MRLIDADALKEAVNGFYDNRFKGLVPSELIEYAQTIDAIIDNAPTVTLEQPTGEWKCFIGSAYYGIDEDNEPIWRERKIYHCPFCDRRTVIKENYCPNCGAKMRHCGAKMEAIE